MVSVMAALTWLSMELLVKLVEEGLYACVLISLVDRCMLFVIVSRYVICVFSVLSL